MKQQLVRLAWGGALAAFMTLPGLAGAATPEQELAAQVAFDEGLQLLEAGNFVEACPRFERAQKLDPGMGTQYRLAECYEGIGRLASAWRHFVDVVNAARAAGRTDREELARARSEALRPRLSTITIAVSAQAASVPGLRVACDGRDVEEVLWGSKVPTDGGVVRIEATAPGYRPWSKVVKVSGEKAALTIDVPLLERLAGAAAVAPPFAQPLPPGPEPFAARTSPSTGLSTQAIAGIIAGATGVVVIGVGVGVGLAARARYDDSDAYCVDNRCQPEGLDIRDSAGIQADVATAVFVVGSAALVGGAVLWIAAPSSSEPAASQIGAIPVQLRIGISPTGVTLGGAW